MKLEILSAANFIAHLLKLSKVHISDKKMIVFKKWIIEGLRKRCKYHWFPEKPLKASGYRCIRINEKFDAIIIKALEECGFSLKETVNIFVYNVIIWINPFEVSYKLIGDDVVYLLYEHENNVDDNIWTYNDDIKIKPKLKPMDYYHIQRNLSLEELVCYLNS
jgi:protein Tob/BTG